MAMQTPSVIYWLGEKLYLNITNQCSNSCYFCFKNYKKGINGFNLKLTEEPSINQIIMAIQEVINKRNWKEIVFCGFGEPLTRLDTVLGVTDQLNRKYVKKIRVDTNGQGQLINKHRNLVEELKRVGVHKISVSLNAHNRQTYNIVCRPKLENAFQEVLNFIERAKEKIDTEITVVTIPEVDIPKVRRIAAEMGVKFRVREYIPCFW